MCPHDALSHVRQLEFLAEKSLERLYDNVCTWLLIALVSGHLRPVRRHMKTPGKKSCAFCPMPVHHMSVSHVLIHKMKLEALWANGTLSLKCNYPWENFGEIERAAEICVDLWDLWRVWRAYIAL